MTKERAHWSGRLAFVLAAAGSAVGLGNIWKFPYITGVNGGGAFVLVYLLCIVIVGIPIFIAELYIGQKSQANTVTAFELAHKPGSPWRVVGYLGVISAFLILSFYSVVGGWILFYLVKSVLGQFASLGDDQIKGVLGELLASPGTIIACHAIFMAGTLAIVMGGIKDGIEKWNRILMPALFALLVFMLIRAMFLDGFSQAIEFLFSPNFEKLTTSGVIEALGHSFFTLSLGMGAMITYGSYLSKKEDLVKTALLVGFMDTFIALAAGVVIFSVVFTFGMAPGSGPALMFVTLPVLFQKLTGSWFLSTAFFLLVSFAAFTSAISLLEVFVTYWDEKHNMDRKKTTIVSGSLIFFLGILSALSFNVLSDVKLFGLTFFDLFDKITSGFALPVGGLMISLFYGWALGPKAVEETIHDSSSFKKWWCFGLLWTTRVIAPLAVIYLLLKDVIHAAIARLA